MRALSVPLLAAASLLLASTPAAAADADEAPAAMAPAVMAPDDVEVMRYPPSSVRFGLIGGGLVALGVPYGIGALCAEAWPEVPGSDWLYAPVIGPWVAFAQNDCAPDDEGCGAIMVLRGILYVVSGVAQAGGVGLVGEGLFMTTEAEETAPEASWTVLPMASPEHAGLGIFGTF
ncbi:MAG: hypothetical protein JRI68_12810 [Deltaproteobacteria bacterium]|nr:hypothetical protein [Deltaproteobacteria bacterium]